MFRTLAIAPQGEALDGRLRPPGRLAAYWAITSASLAAFILAHAFAAQMGPFAPLLAFCGVAGCGWSWLFTRALFDPAEHDAVWPRLVVALILVGGGLAIVAEQGVLSLPAMVGNTAGLASSAALLLTFVEPLHGYRRSLPAAEKRFRLAYVGLYGVLVGASVLLVREAGADAAEAARISAIKSACAFAALVAVSAAAIFRLRHPLPVAAPTGRRAAPTAGDRHLAAEVARLMNDAELYATPDLKLADLARRLGQPEHKVTQAITAGLGFANFNRLVNHHRVARARRMLADPGLADRPILVVAFECGFNSLGPFNRAFKEETGLTPRAYRGAALTPGTG